MGESSAHAPYAAMRMAASGGGRSGGASGRTAGSPGYPRRTPRLRPAATTARRVHARYAPREAGIDLAAKSLGVDRSKMTVSKASTIGRMLMTQKVPDEIRRDPEGGGRPLLACMAGNASSRRPRSSQGAAQWRSPNGGMTCLPGGRGRRPAEFARAAAK